MNSPSRTTINQLERYMNKYEFVTNSGGCLIIPAHDIYEATFDALRIDGTAVIVTVHFSN